MVRWKQEWGDGYIAVSKMGSTTAVTTAKNFIRLARLRPGHRVLDLGAGHGRVTEILVRIIPHLEVVAVDLTRHLLDNFAIGSGTNGCRLRLVQANLDADYLPFRNDEFDAAISSRVFHYLARPIECLRDVGRVVRTGGHVALSVPNRLNPVKRLTYRRATLYSPAEVAKWFNECGFLDIVIGSMCFFPSTHRWHRVAHLAEHTAQIPYLARLGGNVLVAGRRP